MSKVKRIVRYKVTKNGHTTTHKTKAAARKKAHGSMSTQKRHHKKHVV